MARSANLLWSLSAQNCILVVRQRNIMAEIEFRDVSVDFPIYNADARSLKRRLLQVATGGQLGADQNGRVVVRALEGLSFTLKDGDRLGIVGHNGAGKTTM